MTKSCDICGREMIRPPFWSTSPFAKPDDWICPLTPDQHKIAELEKQLKGSRALVKQLADDKQSFGYRFENRTEERDEARSHLRQAQERELALREALSKLLECRRGDELNVALYAKEVMDDTSATAQQTVERVEREKAEKIWIEVCAIGVGNINETEAFTRLRDKLHAAILGPVPVMPNTDAPISVAQLADIIARMPASEIREYFDPPDPDKEKP